MIWVTGFDGMLGSKVFRNLCDAKKNVVGTSSNVDISRSEDVFDYLHNHRYVSLVINCAAYTNVESAEGNGCADNIAVNAHGPGHLARACKERNIHLIHISTDYVFDGSQNRGYRPNDQINPLNAYGQAKLSGENEVLGYANSTIIRTSWLFDRQKGFVPKMYDVIKKEDCINAVYDEISSPTRAEDLAGAIYSLVEQHRQRVNINGVFHYASTGEMSRWEVCNYLYQHMNCSKKKTISPVSQSHFKTKVKRPKYSYLDSRDLKKFDITPPSSETTLQEFLWNMEGK